MFAPGLPWLFGAGETITLNSISVGRSQSNATLNLALPIPSALHNLKEI
jgi:hypothetical protein